MDIFGKYLKVLNIFNYIMIQFNGNSFLNTVMYLLVRQVQLSIRLLWEKCGVSHCVDSQINCYHLIPFKVVCHFKLVLYPLRYAPKARSADVNVQLVVGQGKI